MITKKAYIVVNIPKEGIMGLDNQDNVIPLHNGDMVSEEALRHDFLEFLISKNMLREYDTGIPKTLKKEVKPPSKKQVSKSSIEYWLSFGG